MHLNLNPVFSWALITPVKLTQPDKQPMSDDMRKVSNTVFGDLKRVERLCNRLKNVKRSIICWLMSGKVLLNSEYLLTLI